MDVIILGRIGYDLYSEEPHVPLPQVRRFSRYLGGSSANMAVGLARLGARAGIISCLGNDSLSRFLLEFLNQEKVDTSHVQIAPGYLPSLCHHGGVAAGQLPAGVLPPRPGGHASRRRRGRSGLRCRRPDVRHQRHVAVRFAVARIHVPRFGAGEGGGLPRGARCRLPLHVVEKSRGGRTGGAAGAAVRRCPDRQSTGADAGGRGERSRWRHRKAAPPRAGARLEAGRAGNPRMDRRRFGIPAALHRGRVYRPSARETALPPASSTRSPGTSRWPNACITATPRPPSW